MLFFFSYSSIQSQQFNLKNYSVENGLAQSQVYAIHQDSRGLLWLGTRGGGISVFNGLEFQNYTSAEGLSGNFIRCFAEDPSGYLLTGTDEGICFFDGSKFQSITGFIPHSPVNQLLKLKKKDTWLIATEKSFWEWKKGNSAPKKIRLPEPGFNAQVFCLFEDNRKRVWAGTSFGIFIRNGENWKRISTREKLGSNEIRDIYEDRSGKIWVATYGGGVSWIASNRIYEDSTFVFTTMRKENGLSGNNVVKIFEDRKGNIWIATVDGGASRYDGNEFTHFGENEGLKANHVRCFTEDSWGNIWIGTSGGGLSKFGGDQFIHLTPKTGLPGERVYALEKSNNTLWLGTSAGGITSFENDTFRTWKAQQGFTDEIVKTLYFDPDGSLWAGTEGSGLFRFDSALSVNFNKSTGIRSPWVHDIVKDGRGWMWIATAGGLCHNTPRNPEHFSCLTRKEKLPSDRYNSLLWDQAGILWAGSVDSGLIGIKTNGKFIHLNRSNGLCHNEIRDIAIDKFGHLWVATAEGLVRVNRSANWGGKDIQKETRCYTIADGLASGNLYLVIADSSSGSLIVGSEKGIDVVFLSNEGDIRQVQHFNEAEGFTGIETCKGAGLTTRDGAAWIGTMRGATYFNLRENRANPVPPVIGINQVKILYEDALHTIWAGRPLPFSTIPSSLILPYHKNLLSFSFQGINLRNPEKVVFKSRLLGLSDDWSPPSNNREAVFPNLKPGNYQFEVMAANEDLKWNERPAIFAFSITPAIWVTWWFRILVAGIVISITLLLFRLRLRQVRKEGENQRRKIEMEKQMLELEQKALRLQMNPHFIFNALNSIKGCMAMNDTVAARENLVKFARLMRLILDNSRNSVISLDKEILTIELYLELEKLNRSSSFNYSLSVSENIVPEDIFIPPMILQPFIENAVIHGVGGLTSGGEISIRFSKLNKRLLCEISDNGPGMKADKSRKSIEPGHHSAGIEVTRERLEMLDPEMKIEFSNLQQDAEINKGTRVQIQLPLDLE